MKHTYCRIPCDKMLQRYLFIHSFIPWPVAHSIIQPNLGMPDKGYMLMYKVNIISDLLELYSSQAEGNIAHDK